ncbi:MAG: OmpH family outer membrane protein [Nitrospiraceae bacterium]|nr:MAG: OmpH family outer membrane protein [Nitrospiraceae bacterium]
MKNIIVLILFSVLLSFSAEAAETKIAYVDLQRIVTTSEQGKEALKALESIEKTKNALISDKVKELKGLEEELTKQGAVLTPEAKQKKQAEYESLMMEFQKMRKERDDELKKNEAEFIQKIVIEVKDLLAKIARQEGYTAIFNEAVVVYMPNELNLTERVLKEFNELSKGAKKE